MEHEKYKFAASSQQGVAGHGGKNAEDQSMMDRGAKYYGKAEKAVSDVYDKTEQMVGEKYRHVRSYSREHPGRIVLVALGIGLGLGYILSATTQHHSSTSDLRRYFR